MERPLATREVSIVRPTRTPYHDGAMAWEDAQSSGRFRARELGLSPGSLKTASGNATTVVEGDAVRTGVTAIVPRSGNLFREKVRGGLAVGNAYGKLVVATQL